MGKASRKKLRETERPEGTLRSFPDPPAWSAPLLVAAAILGAGFAAVSTWVHYQVTSSGGAYTSFCNVSAAVNCDSVVASPYGRLLGVPVSVWAVAFYMLLGAVALRARSTNREARDQARADAFGLAVNGALFSAYLAAISLFVLGTFCLLCGGLYLASVLSVFAAWKLASPLSETWIRLGWRLDTARRHPALATGGAALAAVVVFLPTLLGAPTRMTREEVFRSNPRFFDWYTSQPVVEPPRSGGHSRGPENAPIQLIEFSDFECPHCQRAHVTLKDLLSRYRNEVRFVFHHFPLSNQCNDSIPAAGHKHACQAAAAAECAGEQGQFDAFSNLLFANQKDLGPKALEQLAGEVDLDRAKFDACLEGTEAAARVKADVAAGRAAGVTSTPTFFLNGRRIDGNLEYQDWILAFALELDKG